MKILYVAAECKPFSMAGGVADVAGELPVALKKKGLDIEIVTPYYKVIDSKHIKDTAYNYNVFFQREAQSVTVYNGNLEDVPVYFVENNKYFGGDHCSILSCLFHIEALTNTIKESLLSSPSQILCNISNIKSLSSLSSYSQPYTHSQYIPYYDDILRFSFFCRACVDLIKIRKPDIVHINDWVLGYLFAEMELNSLTPKKVLTIHNVAYQGIIGTETIRGWDIEKILLSKKLGTKFLNPPEAKSRKSVNALGLGIELADMVNTVSETYCKEMMLSNAEEKYFEGGNGLEKTIKKKYKQKKVKGILNGFNYRAKSISENFDSLFREKLQAKKDISKSFKNPNGFLLGFVGRAVEQKFLLLMERLDNKSVLEHLLEIKDVNISILATGLPEYEYFIGSFNRDNYSSIIAFDKTKAKQISMGCDIFLMPSLFEPCGITQLESMSNATLPLVRLTGGLKDTVKPYPVYNKEHANGFGFEGNTREKILRNFIASVKNAKDLFFSNSATFRQIQKNAFNTKFLWDDTADRYIEEVYKPILKK